MKKLILTLAILLLPLASYAQQPEDNLPEPVQIAGLTVINIGGGVTAAGGCTCETIPTGASATTEDQAISLWTAGYNWCQSFKHTAGSEQTMCKLVLKVSSYQSGSGGTLLLKINSSADLSGAVLFSDSFEISGTGEQELEISPTIALANNTTYYFAIQFDEAWDYNVVFYADGADLYANGTTINVESNGWDFSEGDAGAKDFYFKVYVCN